MRKIETSATVTADGSLIIQVPHDIPPGEHRVVVMIDESLPVAERPPLEFSAYPVGLVSDNMTFRREDLYDDD